MFIIFGFVILLIIIVLIYLSKVDKINKDVVPIFIIFILLSAPTIYLARSKFGTFQENFANDNPETLDIYYLNETKKNEECDCPGICSKPKKNYKKQFKNVELIDAPIQSQIKSIQANPVKLSAYAGSNNQGSGFNLSLRTDLNNKSTNLQKNENGLYVVVIPMKKLANFSNNKIDSPILNITHIIPTVSLFTHRLITALDTAPINSYIVIATSGSDLRGFIDASPENIDLLITKFKLNLVDQLQNGDSFIGIIFKKSKENYVDIVQEISRASSTTGVYINDLDIIRKGVTYELIRKGIQVEEEEINDVINYNEKPFVKYEYNYIKPLNTNRDFSLVITVEDLDSFVYLSSRKNDEPDSLYQESKDKTNNKIKTFLNDKQPQKWTLESVFNSEFNDMFYIRTFDDPIYYLEVDTHDEEPKLKVNLYKSGSNQYWKILQFPSDKNTYTIMNEKTNLYLGYNNFGGYLYDDNGSVFLTDSSKYNWKFIPGGRVKSDWVIKTTKFTLRDFTSPYDFPTSDNTKYTLKTPNGDIDLSGRSPWNAYYTPIWNGKWIYYGTIQTYTNNTPLSNVMFLEIKLNDNGIGYATDPFLGVNIEIKNAGANILFGYIKNGKYNGYLATFELAPLPLDYKGPQNGYPVRMRYLIINNKDKVFNLSSSNVNNLNAYSAKFDGKTPAIANFLEMTGSATLVNANKGIGFPNQ